MTTLDAKTFRARLELAISRRKITKSALAAAAGVKPSAITQWLNGTTKRYDAEHMLKAADFLRVNVRWLLWGTGPMVQISEEGALAAEAIDVLANESRQQAFDFILYKIDQTQPPIASHNCGSYHDMLAKIIEDMKQRKKTPN